MPQLLLQEAEGGDIISRSNSCEQIITKIPWTQGRWLDSAAAKGQGSRVSVTSGITFKATTQESIQHFGQKSSALTLWNNRTALETKTATGRTPIRTGTLLFKCLYPRDGALLCTLWKVLFQMPNHFNYRQAQLFPPDFNCVWQLNWWLCWQHSRYH